MLQHKIAHILSDFKFLLTGSVKNDIMRPDMRQKPYIKSFE